MKHVLPRTSGTLVVAITLCGIALAARADTLDFQVRGAIRPSCGLAADRATIDLGTVTSADLADGTSAWRGTVLTGVDCVGVTRATVTLSATPYGPDPRFIALSGPDRGVVVEMRSATGQPLPADGSATAGFTWAGAIPQLGFKARYVRTGPLTAGMAAATAQIQVRWE